MGKLQTILIVCLLIAVGIAFHQLREIENQTLVPSPVAVAPGKGSKTRESASKNSGQELKKAEEFLNLVQKEAKSIARLSENPEKVQKRLTELAAEMKEADVEVLHKYALNTDLSGDERFLLVYILGESNLPAAQGSLEAIAATPIPPMKEERLTTQEEIIRVQAVESLREAERLKRVLAQTENAFISDRAQRNLLYREGKVSASPEQQDIEALNQLLKKSRQ